MNHNCLDDVARSAFEGPVSIALGALDLSSNNLTHFPVEAMTHVKYVSHLDLQNNSITEVPSHALKSLSLKYLYLQRNRISNVSVEAFHDVKHLEWLYLSGNKLTTLHARTFRAIKNSLKILDIHGKWNKEEGPLNEWRWRAVDHKGLHHEPDVLHFLFHSRVDYQRLSRNRWLGENLCRQNCGEIGANILRTHEIVGRLCCQIFFQTLFLYPRLISACSFGYALLMPVRGTWEICRKFQDWGGPPTPLFMVTSFSFCFFDQVNLNHTVLGMDHSFQTEQSISCSIRLDSG